MSIKELLWPVLQSDSKTELEALRDAEERDIAAIEAADWSEDVDLALIEARRLVSEEEERRRTTDSKASTLLLVAIALVPLVTYLEGTIWNNLRGTPLWWLSIVLLALAIGYLVSSARWAFLTIAVKGYHKVYINELLSTWSSGDNIKTNLVQRLLTATRKNQNPVNDKVSALLMTHAFLIRAVVALALAMFARIASALWENGGSTALKMILSIIECGTK